MYDDRHRIRASDKILLERMFPKQGSWYERWKLEELLRRIKRDKKKKKKGRRRGY